MTKKVPLDKVFVKLNCILHPSFTLITISRRIALLTNSISFSFQESGKIPRIDLYPSLTIESNFFKEYYYN